jgi:hypothetical protein
MGAQEVFRRRPPAVGPNDGPGDSRTLESVDLYFPVRVSLTFTSGAAQNITHMLDREALYLLRRFSNRVVQSF